MAAVMMFMGVVVLMGMCMPVMVIAVMVMMSMPMFMIVPVMMVVHMLMGTAMVVVVVMGMLVDMLYEMQLMLGMPLIQVWLRMSDYHPQHIGLIRQIPGTGPIADAVHDHGRQGHEETGSCSRDDACACRCG